MLLTVLFCSLFMLNTLFASQTNNFRDTVHLETILREFQHFDPSDLAVVEFLNDHSIEMLDATEYLLQTRNVDRIREIKTRLLAIQNHHSYDCREYWIMHYETSNVIRIEGTFDKTMCDLVIFNPRFIMNDSDSDENEFEFCPNNSPLLSSSDQGIKVYILHLRNFPAFVNKLNVKYEIYFKIDSRLMVLKNEESLCPLPSLPSSTIYQRDLNEIFHLEDPTSNDSVELILSSTRNTIQLPDYFCNIKIERISEHSIPVCSKDSLLIKSLKVYSIVSHKASNILPSKYDSIPIIQLGVFLRDFGSRVDQPFLQALRNDKNRFINRISMRERYVIHNSLFNEMYQRLVSSGSIKSIGALPFFYSYIDDFPNFKQQFQHEAEFQDLMVLKEFVEAGTPEDNDKIKSILKFSLTNNWYSSFYAEAAARAAVLHHLNTVLSQEGNVIEFKTSFMRDVPPGYNIGDANPMRYELRIRANPFLMSEFFPSYFLAFFKDPRIGEEYQRQIMSIIFQAVKNRFFSNESEENMKYIEKSFLNGKTWYIERGYGTASYSKSLLIDVKTSFYVKNVMVVADSKRTFSWQLWKYGFS